MRRGWCASADLKAEARTRSFALWLVKIFVIAFGLSVVLPSHAAAQTGRIRGRVIAVTADKREPQPGVLITLSGELLPGKTTHTLSNDDGSYSFVDLMAGDYVLSVELQGFEKYSQKVMVPIGGVVEVNIDMKPDVVTESLTIQAEDGAKKTDSTVPSQITAATLGNAPLINERFQDALPLLPGVVRGPDGLLNLKGARATQSGLLVSSINATDPVTGQAAVELPIEVVENLQVFSNPYSAEYGKFTGAVTSIETRAGTNQWKYFMSSFTPRLRRRAGSIRGIEAWTPRVSFSGPIVKDKFFFLQGLEYRYVRTRVPSLPDLQNDRRLETFDSFSRFDYNISSASRMTVTFSVFPQKLDFANLNTFNLMETTPNFHQRGWFWALTEQSAFAGGSLLQSSFSIKQYDADVFGNSASPFAITPERNLGGWFNRQHRRSRRYEWQEGYYLPTHEWHGRHAFKLGLNLSYSTFDGFDLNRPIRILRADGTLSQLETFVGEGSLKQNNGEVTAYLQDKWTVRPSLILDWGVRYDRDGISEANNVAPRLGFVLLPFKTSRTVVRGGIGLFFDKIPLNVGVFEQYQQMVVTQFGPDGVTVVDGPRRFRNVIDQGRYKTPYSVAWNVEVDRELTPRWLLRLGYEERNSRRDFILDRASGPAGDLALLSNDGRSRYREAHLVARVRLQESQNLFFAYVRSRATGDLNYFNAFIGNFHNPVVRPNEYSRLPFDVPNRFLFWGDIKLPHDVLATPVADWRDGFPFSLVDENQNFVGPRNRGGRFPTFLSVDLQVSKGFTIPFRGRRYRARAGVKIFNITNHWNPRDVQSNIQSLAFGTFSNSVSRTFRGKFQFEF